MHQAFNYLQCEPIHISITIRKTAPAHAVSSNVPRVVEDECCVTQRTFTQMIGVWVPCGTKPQQSSPKWVIIVPKSTNSGFVKGQVCILYTDPWGSSLICMRLCRVWKIANNIWWPGMRISWKYKEISLAVIGWISVVWTCFSKVISRCSNIYKSPTDD